MHLFNSWYCFWFCFITIKQFKKKIDLIILSVSALIFCTPSNFVSDFVSGFVFDHISYSVFQPDFVSNFVFVSDHLLCLIPINYAMLYVMLFFVSFMLLLCSWFRFCWNMLQIFAASLLLQYQRNPQHNQRAITYVFCVEAGKRKRKHFYVINMF